MKIIKLKEKDLNNIIKKVLRESYDQNIDDTFNDESFEIQWKNANDVAEEVQAWWKSEDDRYGFFRKFNYWYKADDDKGAAKAYRKFVNKEYLPRLKDNYWLHKFEVWFNEIVDEIDDWNNDKCYMTLESYSTIAKSETWSKTYYVDPEIDWF